MHDEFSAQFAEQKEKNKQAELCAIQPSQNKYMPFILRYPPLYAIPSKLLTTESGDHNMRQHNRMPSFFKKIQFHFPITFKRYMS
jgi:hypothetical protein